MGEVASAFVTLVPSAKGFGKGISSQIGGDVDSAGKSAGKRFGGGMSSGLAGIGTKVFAPLAAAAAAVGIGSFFKDAVAGASDLSESTSKVGVVFGKQAGQIVAASKTAASAMGLSQQAYLEATGTLGNLLVSLDIAPKKSAAMSTQMVKLAGDLASFNNVSPEEALDALKSGLTGETEPLKRFGVNMNDATLKAQALKMGLIKSTKDALNPQSKALAAQALIMKQTKTAQGDFARTSGGLANQQRILAAQFVDVKAKLGSALLPTVTKVVKFFNASIPKVVAFGNGVGAIISILAKGDFKGAAATFGLQEDSGVVDFLFTIHDSIVAIGSFITGTAIPAVKGFLASFQSGGGASGVVAALQGLVAFVRGQVIPAVMGIVTAVRGYISVVLPIVQAFVAGMVARITPLMPQIRTVFSTIGQIITGVMGLIQAIIQRVTTVISFIWSHWGQNIMDFVGKVFGAILNIVGGALKILAGIIKVVTSVIRGDWSGAWAGIKQIVSGAWQAIKGIVSGALTILGGVIRGGATLLKGAMTFVGDKINSALSGLASAMANKGRELIQGLIDGIMDKIQAVKDAAGKVAEAIKDFFPGSPVKEGPLTSWNNGGAGKRLGGMLADGLTASKAQVRAASSGLAGSVAMDASMASASGQSATGLIQSLQTALERATLNANISAGDVQRAAIVGYRG